MKNTAVNLQSQTSTQIYLNSGNADMLLNGTSKSNVVFVFQAPIILNKNVIEMRLSIVNAQVPVSWYLINSTNNKICITLGGVKTAYLFPTGNYNVNSFIAAWVATFGANWTVTYNNVTNKMTFSYTASFSFSDDACSLFSIIGFVPGETYVSSSNALTSSNSINFYGLNRLQVKSSTFQLNNVDSYKKGVNRTLGIIPITNLNGGICFYNNFTNYRNVFKNREISTIGIEFQDDYKNYIDFNNIDWSLTLQIDILAETVEDLQNLEDVYKSVSF